MGNIRFSNIIIFSSLFLVSCVVVHTHQITYRGKLNQKELKNLKTQGYYLNERPNAQAPFSGFILYQNGSVFGLIEDYFTSKMGFESNFEISKTNKNHDKIEWGAYIIEKDSIKIQLFYPGRGSEIRHEWDINTYSGKITNDSTIFITNRNYTTEDRSSNFKMNNKYHFVQFIPKPDSTRAN